MNEGRPMKEPLTAVQPRMAMAHLWCALPAAGRRPAATCSVGGGVSLGVVRSGR
jgi:hypothetical protein